MVARLLPHPLLSLLIVVFWLLLINQLSMGHLVLGTLIAVAVPKFTSAYWPARVRIRNPAAIASYALIVLWDIVVANMQVAWLILFHRGDRLRSHFVAVPLSLTSPEAITVLAGTVTMTPGTVSCDVSADGRALLVHCLDVADTAEMVAAIQSRYERRLQEIFE